MPKVTWERLNKIIHRCKGSLAVAYKTEELNRKANALSVKMRKRLETELKEIEDIILEQANGDG